MHKNTRYFYLIKNFFLHKKNIHVHVIGFGVFLQRNYWRIDFSFLKGFLWITKCVFP